MLTCGVVFAAEAATFVDRSLALFERVLTVATSVSTVLVRLTT